MWSAEEKKHRLLYSRALPVGFKNGGSIPVVNAIRWNQDPSQLDAQRAFACASSHGIRVYQNTLDYWRLNHNKVASGSREGLCVEWNPANARMLATGTGCCHEQANSGGHLRLLEYRTGDSKFHTRQIFGPMANGGVVGSLSFSSNGNYLVAAVYGCGCKNEHQANRSILAINLTSSRFVQITKDYPDGGEEEFVVKFHPRVGKMFLSASKVDSKVLVWCRLNANWQVISSIDVGGVCGLSFNGTGSYLVTLGSHRRIKTWKFDTTTTEILSLKTVSEQRSDQYPDSPTSFSWMSNKYLAAGGNTKICIYETTRWGSTVHHVHTRRNHTHGGMVTCLEWNAKELLLASGGKDGFVVLWHLLQPNQVTPPALTRFYLKEANYYNEVPYKLPDPDPDETDIDDRRSLSVISTSSEGSRPSIDDLVEDLAGGLEDLALEETEVELKLKAIKDRAVVMRDRLTAGDVPRAELISSYEEIIELCYD